MNTLVVLLDIDGHNAYSGSYMGLAEKNHFNTSVLTTKVTDVLIDAINDKYDNVIIPSVEGISISEIESIFKTGKTIYLSATLNAGYSTLKTIVDAYPNVKIFITMQSEKKMVNFYKKPIYQLIERIKSYSFISGINYEFEIQNYESILTDISYLKQINKPYVFKFMFNKTDADFVEALSSDKKEILKTALITCFGDEVFTKKSPSANDPSIAFYGPGSIGFRANIQGTVKDCSNCYCLIGNSATCSDCFAYGTSSTYDEDYKILYIKDVERIRKVLGI